MFVENYAIDSNIEENAKLWRYMDFAKLVSLLSNQSLYLCKSDEFRDVFEGRLFGLEKVKKFLESQVITIGEGESMSISYDEYAKVRLDSANFARENIFINCWHLNEEQSAAMWDLYVKNGEGIAVQTTFGRIKQSLNFCEKNIYIGKVEYIDHKNGENHNEDYIHPFFTKRLSFKHEEEVRLVYSALDDNDFWKDIKKYEDIPGINFKVDLTKLIERIYVSPDAPRWFVDVVRIVLEKFNIEAEIIHSKLYELN